MIKPTTNDLNARTNGDFNRYEIALATAKCARMITNEYVRQRTEAESSMTGNKETDKPLNAMIDREVRDEKAVKIAIGRIYNGEYRITHKPVEEQEREERAILEGPNGKRNDIDDRPLDDDEDELTDEPDDRIEDVLDDTIDDTIEDAIEDAIEDVIDDDEGGSDDTDDTVEDAADEAHIGDAAESAAGDETDE